MGKQLVNAMIAKMQKAGIVTKVTPWLHEEGDESRYVGCKPKDWHEIMDPDNNVLMRFVVDKNNDTVQILLANRPPFMPLTKTVLTKESKWETVLGELKRQLKKDKQECIQGNAKVGNLYQKMAGQLKK